MRKDWPVLVSLLNKALFAMSPSHKTTIPNKWIAVRYEHGLKTHDVIKWIGVVLGSAFMVVLLFFLHNRSLRKEILQRKAAQKEREEVIHKLQNALLNIKKLSGLLPICSSCKKIRNDQGYWQQVEQYLEQHSEAEFSHSICPDCVARLYPELKEELSK